MGRSVPFNILRSGGPSAVRTCTGSSATDAKTKEADTPRGGSWLGTHVVSVRVAGGIQLGFDSRAITDENPLRLDEVGDDLFGGAVAEVWRGFTGIGNVPEAQHFQYEFEYVTTTMGTHERRSASDNIGWLTMSLR